MLWLYSYFQAYIYLHEIITIKEKVVMILTGSKRRGVWEELEGELGGEMR